MEWLSTLLGSTAGLSVVMSCLLSSDCGPPCPLVVVTVEVVVVVVVKWCQLTAQEDQGVGKVTRPIPISLSGTPAKK